VAYQRDPPLSSLRAWHSPRRTIRLRKRVLPTASRQTRLRSYLATLVSVPFFLGVRSADAAIWICPACRKTRLPRSHAVGVVARNDDGEAECSVVCRRWIPACAGMTTGARCGIKALGAAARIHVSRGGSPCSCAILVERNVVLAFNGTEVVL